MIPIVDLPLENLQWQRPIVDHRIVKAPEIEARAERRYSLGPQRLDLKPAEASRGRPFALEPGKVMLLAPVRLTCHACQTADPHPPAGRVLRQRANAAAASRSATRQNVLS